MLERARYVAWQSMRNELEALLVEAELINIHQPPFNTLLKDDKSPLYIIFTNEDFPRVLKVRSRDLRLKKYQKVVKFGPFPSGYKVNEVLKIARRIFPWCNQKRSKKTIKTKTKPCFYHHLRLCSGVCTGEISREDYGEMMGNLQNFLRGKKTLLLRDLAREMKREAAREEYEKAGRTRDKIKLVEEVTSENYRLRQGFFLPTLYDNAQGGRESLVYLRSILHDYLRLPADYQLRRIEGYDVSNTSGKKAMVSMVVAIEGEMRADEYRLFGIDNKNEPDDYLMHKMAQERRQKHFADWGRPDLIVIDGGKGQVRSALKAYDYQMAVPIIGLVKNPDRIVLPIKIERSGKTAKIEYKILSLAVDDMALKLLSRIRDEAHRFSKRAHLRRREKDLFD